VPKHHRMRDAAEEAAEFKLECIERMLPYTHSEMPRAVDVTIAEGGDAGLAVGGLLRA
jgi:hypothetical protein